MSTDSSTVSDNINHQGSPKSGMRPSSDGSAADGVAISNFPSTDVVVGQSPPPHNYRHSRAYRHFKNPPQPHMCIRVTTVAGEELFINVLSWARIVIPQEPSDPIPLYGGMKVLPGSPRCPPLVYAVMANPEVLKDSGRHSKDPEERGAMVELMCDFVEAMNPDVKLTRNAVILKDRDISGELKDVWNAVQAQRDREREEQMPQQQQQQQPYHQQAPPPQQMFYPQVEQQPQTQSQAQQQQQQSPSHHHNHGQQQEIQQMQKSVGGNSNDNQILYMEFGPESAPNYQTCGKQEAQLQLQQQQLLSQPQQQQQQQEEQPQQQLQQTNTKQMLFKNNSETMSIDNHPPMTVAQSAININSGNSNLSNFNETQNFETGPKSSTSSSLALSSSSSSSSSSSELVINHDVTDSKAVNKCDTEQGYKNNEVNNENNVQIVTNMKEAMINTVTMCTATTGTTAAEKIQTVIGPSKSTTTAVTVSASTTAARVVVTTLPTSTTSTTTITSSTNMPTQIPTPTVTTKKEKLGGFLPNGCHNIFPRFKNNKHKDKEKDKEKDKDKETNSKSLLKEKTLLNSFKRSSSTATTNSHNKSQNHQNNQQHQRQQQSQSNQAQNQHEINKSKQYEKNCINLEAEMEKLDLSKIDSPGNDVLIKLKVASSGAK